MSSSSASHFARVHQRLAQDRGNRSRISGVADVGDGGRRSECGNVDRIDSLGHVKYAEQATEPAQHARRLGHVGGSLTCRYVLIVQDTPVDQVPRDRVEPPCPGGTGRRPAES